MIPTQPNNILKELQRLREIKWAYKKTYQTPAEPIASHTSSFSVAPLATNVNMTPTPPVTKTVRFFKITKQPQNILNWNKTF